MKRPPLAVIVVAVLLLLVGAVGLFGDASDFKTVTNHYEIPVRIAVHLLAMLAGIFLLRGRNWARWLAVAWMAFHVAISYPSAGKIAGHSVFLLLFVWLLFLMRASRAWFSQALTPAP